MGWSVLLAASIFLSLTVPAQCDTVENVVEEEELSQPTVMVAILVRNKAHVLPYFLHYLEQQEYPKQRMSIW